MRLKSYKFAKHFAGGEYICFSSDVTVSKDGEFSVGLPKEYGETARKWIEGPESEKGAYFNETHGGNFRISGTNLERCTRSIVAIVEDYYTCEVTESLVIKYSIESRAEYVKDSRNGAIFSNGYYADFDSEFVDWVNLESGDTDSSAYLVGIAVEVVNKRIHKRASGDIIEYLSPDLDRDDDTYLTKLNSFNHIHAEDDGDEIEATEANAKFFYEFLIGLCTLADKFDQFFGSRETVLKAIAANVVPMLQSDDFPSG